MNTDLLHFSKNIYFYSKKENVIKTKSRMLVISANVCNIYHQIQKKIGIKYIVVVNQLMKPIC